MRKKLFNLTLLTFALCFTASASAHDISYASSRAENVCFTNKPSANKVVASLTIDNSGLGLPSTTVITVFKDRRVRVEVAEDLSIDSEASTVTFQCMTGSRKLGKKSFRKLSSNVKEISKGLLDNSLKPVYEPAEGAEVNDGSSYMLSVKGEKSAISYSNGSQLPTLVSQTAQSISKSTLKIKLKEGPEQTGSLT